MCIGFACCANADDLSPEVRAILMDRCSGCHDQSVQSGGIDLIGPIDGFSASRDIETWEKVDVAISKSKMPPPDEEQLDQHERDTIAEWFERQFVKPGGVQHAGLVLPRRLTREELQNTLEDILHVDNRAAVATGLQPSGPAAIVKNSK